MHEFQTFFDTVPHNPKGGTAQTWQACRCYRKAYRLINGDTISAAAAAAQLQAFIAAENIRKLNIAGPRQSRKPQAYQYAYQVISRLLSEEKKAPLGAGV